MTEDARAARKRCHVVLSTRAVRASAGSARVVLALAAGFAGAGHRVEIVADRLDTEAVRAAGAEPRQPLGLAALQWGARLLLGSEQLLALRERAVAGAHADLVIGEGDLRRQDVVVVHNIMRREVEALGVAATPAHEQAATAQERALRQNAYRLAVANSELTRREFSRCFGMPAERVAVVRPGHDATQFRADARAALRDATRQALGAGEQETLVAFISSGHFTLRGVEVLGATLALLPAATRSRLCLLCAGSEGNVGLLRSTLARAGVEVRIIAQPRTAQVERYYHAADLLFHPALFETFGLVVAEAAACGTPVLTSAAVGAAELFSGEGQSAVAARPDAALFAPLLARLVNEPAWARAVADSQRNAVAPRTWPAYAAEFIAATRPLLSAPPSSTP